MLIVVGAIIIGVVLLLRLGLRRSGGGGISSVQTDRDAVRSEEAEFDPLFAVDTKVSEVSERALASVGKIVIEEDSEPDLAPPTSSAATDGHDYASQAQGSWPKRRPPRVADDPQRVVVLNVIANGERFFSGQALRDALEHSGFEYGEWQIFHCYSPMQLNAPPLFSLANMVKPGSFDLEQMADLTTAGLSLFMVPAGVDNDIVTFDTMLAKARQLAEILGGELRDARRSVLTRQGISQIREQLNEWRHKAQVAHH